MNAEEAAARSRAAALLMPDTPTERELHALRVFAGTERRAPKWIRGSRVLRRFFDFDYTAVIPPWVLAIAIVGLAALVAIGVALPD